MIRHPKEEEIPRLFEIWERCFGDTPESISLFFKNRFDAAETWITETDGVPSAVLYLLPCRVAGGQTELPARYLYAAATHPDMQGHGLMTRLLDHAAQDCRQRGMAYLLLVPGSRELFRFYEKRGYHTAFSLDKARLDSKQAECRCAFSGYQPDAGELLSIRRAVLGQGVFVDWDVRALGHVLEDTRRLGGQAVAVSCEGQKGYALCLPEKERVFVSEWMAPPALFGQLRTAVCREYPGKEVLLRTAEGLLPGDIQRETVSFGMACPLLETLTSLAPSAYLGLPMD